jgi:hypothetical protein
MIPLAHGDPQPAPLPCRARHHGFTAKIFNNMKYNAFFWALRDFIWVRVREKFNTKTHYKNRLLICKPILGQVTTTLFPSDLQRWGSFNPRKIHKNDINASTVFTDMPVGFPLTLADYTSGRWVFYGTWESDWWASLKTIVNPCSVWIDHSTNVKMKYSHEWYFFNCGVASSLWPATNSTWEVNNAKCRFILRRTI